MTQLQAVPHDDAPVQKVAGGRRVIVFHLAGQEYGLPVTSVREIVHLPQLSQPPALPSVLAGFLNLGGASLPVIRLARLFGLKEQAPNLYTPLVILQSADVCVGLMVDAVSGIISVDDQTIVPVGENFCCNNCAVGLVPHGQGHVVLLAADRILLDEEQRRFADLAAIEQVRLAQFEEGRS